MLYAVKRPDGSYIESVGRTMATGFEKAILVDRELYRIAHGASENNVPTQLKAATSAGFSIEEVKIVSVVP